MDQEHAPADQHDASQLWPPERLVPQHMAEHRYNCVARGNRRKCGRDRYLLESQNIAERSDNINCEPSGLRNCAPTVADPSAADFSAICPAMPSNIAATRLV
jgi:hypothetical protein